MVTVSMTFIDH